MGHEHMKYQKLKEIAEGLTAVEVEARLRQLCQDERFAAVVRLILDVKDVGSDAACQLQFADHHGLLAHAAGVRYGMIELEGRIKTAAEPPKARGPKQPAAPERD